MKRKLFISASAVVLCLLVTMSAVSGAINFLSTDGYWSYIDSGYDGVRIDVVGVIGIDPGSAWSVIGKSTRDYRLIRNSDVCTHDPDGDETLYEWTGTTPPVYTSLGSHTYGPGACEYQGLFISEYIEGEGSNADAIEIYNNTGSDIVFADKPYWITIFNNGSQRASIAIELTGTLLKNQTYVIASSDIAGVTEQLVTSDLSFSGDDAVALVRGYRGNDSEPDGATNDTWATGPTTAGPNGATGLTTNTDNPAVQLTVTTDWNQVRYGVGTGGNGFAYQSGLAFHGVTRGENPPAYGDQVPFLVGKFCHINNEISGTNLNEFKSCPLTLDLMNIGCGDYAVAPYPPTKMTFVYPVYLDETTNSGTCTYVTDPPGPACADAVTFGDADSTFTCYYIGGVTNEYKVAILGFMPVSENGSCNAVSYNQSSSTGIFVSNEGATNCGCLFAMITQGEITGVNLLSFDAFGEPEGIQLTWETANETDNLGFNLYRSDSLIGERILLNQGLIPTNIPPGSPFGSVYKYLDKTAETGKLYLYWLEDIGFEGVATVHGPTSAIRQ